MKNQSAQFMFKNSVLRIISKAFFRMSQLTVEHYICIQTHSVLTCNYVTVSDSILNIVGKRKTTYTEKKFQC